MSTLQEQCEGAKRLYSELKAQNVSLLKAAQSAQHKWQRRRAKEIARVAEEGESLVCGTPRKQRVRRPPNASRLGARRTKAPMWRSARPIDVLRTLPRLAEAKMAREQEAAKAAEAKARSERMALAAQKAAAAAAAKAEFAAKVELKRAFSKPNLTAVW